MYVLPLEIHLSRGDGWDTIIINQLSPATFLCLSQARIWISNVTFFMFGVLGWRGIVRFVEIGWMVDHQIPFVGH